MHTFCKQLFRFVSLAMAIIWCLPAITLAASKQPAAPPAPVKVTILATAGLNGHIINWDYNLPGSADFGLVKVSSLVKKERQTNPYTILVDAGNMLSGTPLTNYFATEPSKLPNPMIAMYNYLGYDALVLGDGEFAYGPDYLSKSLASAKFPILAANAHSSGKLATTIKPYTIKELQVGKDKKKEIIRIGIIGVTNASPDGNPQNYAGLTFNDQTAAINDAVKKLQNKVDAVVIMKNNGIEINGTMAAAPGKFGSSLSRTELIFEKIGKNWQVKQMDTTSIYAVIVPADKAMADAAWPYHDATLQHLGKRP
ncbi:MAG: CycNucDiestase: 2,3-cyclic-nucleotide 2-phosphodieSPTERase [Sporomusa sp.]|nr:CycNucDiestase: 2,3-cyclic-nucleotide 2-phosphodieSPTERase [Sporomusa sp.]